MSEVTQVQTDAEINDAQSSAADQEQIVATKPAEELARRLKEVSLEAKQNRQKASELKKQLEDATKQKLQEEGKFKELSEVWQRKATDYEAQSNKLKQAFALKTISDTVALEAQKLGCIDPDALISLLPLDQIPIDDQFNVDRDSARAILEEFKKSKSYFFQKPSPKIADAAPAKPAEPQMNLSKMSLADRAALLAQLNKQGK